MQDRLEWECTGCGNFWPRQEGACPLPACGAMEPRTQVRVHLRDNIEADLDAARRSYASGLELPLRCPDPRCLDVLYLKWKVEDDRAYLSVRCGGCGTDYPTEPSQLFRSARRRR